MLLSERFLSKVLISAVIVASVSEIGRRSSWMAAILASLPVTSILALVWLYRDTQDNGRIISLCYGIFWGVLPSLLFFLFLPFLLKAGFNFAPALLISCAFMALSYGVYLYVLSAWGLSV